MGQGEVDVEGKGTATVAVFPEDYSQYKDLKVANDGKTVSVDEFGAKKAGKKANCPLNYVKDLQADLMTLGYLAKGSANGVYGTETARAVLRFQRHAARVYRMPGPADVEPSKTFTGDATGICDSATAVEIKAWRKNSFVNPVGRFTLRKLDVPGAESRHKLREDAADEWETIVKSVGTKGGILTAEGNGYGDSLRGLAKTSKSGTSSFSFHYCGRAVDIDQSFTFKGNKLKVRRYYVEREDLTEGTFWRIWCKTDLQDGTQGSQIAAKTRKHVSDFSTLATSDIPEGYYLDVTSEIETSGKFKRIRAQKGFDDTTLASDARYNKTEWWHFQFTVDVQETFLDELELIGKTEEQVKAAGWKTVEELDHKPG
jgi:hypothetical protein